MCSLYCDRVNLHGFLTRSFSDLAAPGTRSRSGGRSGASSSAPTRLAPRRTTAQALSGSTARRQARSAEHTSGLQALIQIGFHVLLGKTRLNVVVQTIAVARITKL